MPLDPTSYHHGSNLASFTDSLIATKASREPDWNTLAFQEKAGHQYRRAQIRCVGSGATGATGGTEG